MSYFVYLSDGISGIDAKHELFIDGFKTLASAGEWLYSHGYAPVPTMYLDRRYKPRKWDATGRSGFDVSTGANAYHENFVGPYWRARIIESELIDLWR